MILVLDNMEHLLTAADEVAAVVHASPASRIIVTSRAPLRIAGEHELPVAPLVDDAVAELFTDRARAVRPGWEPATRRRRGRRRDLRTCSTTCRSASSSRPRASRHCRRRSSATASRRVCRCPGSGLRDAPARQRTLEGAVAWSHDLLPPDRQDMLHRLGVFEGGFDLEQVDASGRPIEGRR